MTDIATARDDIHTVFEAAWLANTAAVNGGVVPEVKYETVPNSQTPGDVDEQWARITIRHSDAGQTAFGDGGISRYEKRGIVAVQIFASLRLDEPAIRAEALAQIAKNAFEGAVTTNRVFFRNVTINEVGVDDAWYNVNVLAEFEYDELR